MDEFIARALDRDIITKTLNIQDPYKKATPIQFAVLMLLVLFIGVASVFIFMYTDVPYIPIDRPNETNNNFMSNKIELRKTFNDYRSSLEKGNFSTFNSVVTPRYLESFSALHGTALSQANFESFKNEFFSDRPLLNQAVIESEIIGNETSFFSLRNKIYPDKVGIVWFKKVGNKWKVNLEVW